MRTLRCTMSGIVYYIITANCKVPKGTAANGANCFAAVLKTVHGIGYVWRELER